MVVLFGGLGGFLGVCLRIVDLRLWCLFAYLVSCLLRVGGWAVCGWCGFRVCVGRLFCLMVICDLLINSVVARSLSMVWDLGLVVACCLLFGCCLVAVGYFGLMVDIGKTAIVLALLYDGFEFVGVVCG